MRKILTIIASSLLSAPATPAINIVSGEQYRIACAKTMPGAIVLGANHDAVPIVYYATKVDPMPDDAWWTITRTDKGYTIANALSGQYLVYTSQREMNMQNVYTTKYLTVSDDGSDDTALWTFEQANDTLAIIRNVSNSDYFFNLRASEQLVGTYHGSSNESNSHFSLYNRSGEVVTFSETAKETVLSAVVDSLRLNGKDLVYDNSEGAFYAVLPETARGDAPLVATLEVHAIDSLTTTITATIDGIAPADDGTITLPAIDGTVAHTIAINDSRATQLASAPLYFTYLPIVEINTPGCNSSSYTTGTIRVTDPNVAGYDSTFIAAYKYRGASSINYPKKNYAIKLRDGDGNSVDRKLLDLREDNNWILDAMVVDYACMRNRVATDLWNDFSAKPYHSRAGWEKKVRNGTRGKFVEVFLGGSYHGLYCMTEKLDRKQLKLKKFVAATGESTDTIHGTLYKGTDWTYEVLMGHEPTNDTMTGQAPAAYDNTKKSETWSGWEIKYPDYEDEAIDWGPLWNAINFVATADDTEFDSGVSTWFDFPVVTDYYLFLELLLAADNNGKNTFLYNYDIAGSKYAKMMSIAPWDLDGTWGRNWNGTNTSTGAEQSYKTFLAGRNKTLSLFLRLRDSQYWNWEERCRERYNELRNTYFDEAALVKRFTDYESLFVESGADLREEKAWSKYHSDITADVDYITDWLHSRLSYLDEQYAYTTSLHDVTATTAHLSAVGGRGTITIYATQPTTVTIYNLSGQAVRHVTLSQPHATVGNLPPSIYIVGGNKVIVE